jgi:hydroxymethylpyrimidine/phosphomethylpyrimidine kinase
MVSVSLSIAGSDPSGGAGIQADLKVFQHFRSYGMGVVTLLTVQNTVGVKTVQCLDPNFVLDQLRFLLDDIPPTAIKTGALGNAEIVDAVSIALANSDFPVIVDPVMISKHQKKLLDGDGVALLKKKLLPNVYMVTPNIPEAEILSERHITTVAQMEKAAVTISKLGPKHVLIKGGHLADDATDVLLSAGTSQPFFQRKIDTQNTHGTGCALSAAITAGIANRLSVPAAVKAAKLYITAAIKTAPELGKGFGPINFFPTAY